MVGDELVPYVTAWAVCAVCAVCDVAVWAKVCVMCEVCGRVKSSKRSARRGWCMWRFVIEESLLFFLLVFYLF